jgi:hypothetical protein
MVIQAFGAAELLNCRAFPVRVTGFPPEVVIENFGSETPSFYDGFTVKY